MDRYDLQARHTPVAVTILPLILLGIGAIPDVRQALWLPIIGLAGLSGVYWLLARYARARGRELERRLFLSWGGTPTTAILRHRDSRINRHSKAIYHDRLRRMPPGFIIPTEDEEQLEPAQADERYGAAMDELRRRAKATKNAIVHRENINYGAARNFLALKPIGIVAAVGCLVAFVFIVGTRVQWYLDLARSIDIALAAILMIDIVGWIAIVRGSVVRHQADAYALALIESAED
jgi:hypothetical protein